MNSAVARSAANLHRHDSPRPPRRRDQHWRHRAAAVVRRDGPWGIDHHRLTSSEHVLVTSTRLSRDAGPDVESSAGGGDVPRQQTGNEQDGGIPRDPRTAWKTTANSSIEISTYSSQSAYRQLIDNSVVRLELRSYNSEYRQKQKKRSTSSSRF